MNKLHVDSENLYQYECSDIFSIEKYGDETWIHFNGYVYYCEDGEAYGTPYRMVDYILNMIPLEQWIKEGMPNGDECNSMFNNDKYQCILDCTEEDAINFLNHYSGGEPPYILDTSDYESLPVGTYIIKKRS